jgi:cell division septation protein DedD
VSTRAQDAALAAYDRLRDAGYPAVIDPEGRGAAAVYRVRLAGLPTREDAVVLAKRIAAEFDLKGATVSR